MRHAPSILLLGLLTGILPCPALVVADEATPPPITCSNGVPGGISCIVSKKDLKEARAAYARGMKLQEHKHLEDAFAQFDDALKLAPQDPQFLTARETVKAQLVFDHVERGNALLSEGRSENAATEFRAALDLDPENEFAREQLQEASRNSVPALTAAIMPTTETASEIRLQPTDARATIRYTGDVRGLFTELGAAYGVTVQFDDPIPTRTLRFNVEDVDFFAALRLACQVSRTMWSALSAHQLLIAADTSENHRQFDRLSLQTFQVPAHTGPQDATEVMNALRTLFDLRFVSLGQTANTIEVRAPQPILEACTKLMAQFNGERPQVMFDIRVYQINHQFTRNIGLHIPDSFNLFNIPVSALAALGGQNIQSLINQLVASGGINQANSTALSGLLAQLQGQQNSIFSQPLATFGGGLTFEGLSLDKLSATLSLNESWVRSLEHMTMRASQGTDATFHLGTRYPILNATYAPIYNSPQISKVLGNQSYIPPFPSVSYEDLGLNLKAKPVIHGNGDVSVQMELQVRSLTGQSTNGVPVISNREYKGSINLRDGETAVVAGQISRTDQRSMAGIPGLIAVPGLNKAATENSAQENDDELMIVMTPHVLSNFDRTTDEIWITAK